MKNYLFIIFVISTTLSWGQKVTENSLRILFHKIETEEDLETILSHQENLNTNISKAYSGSVTVMKAQYAFSPIKKYSYFKEGTKLIEASISHSKKVENIYLRLLIQLNTPHFLGYYENIDQDISFIASNIDICSLTKHWKLKLLEGIIQFESDKYDFSRIEKKISLYKKV